MAKFIRTAMVSFVLAGLVLIGYWRLSLDQQAKTIQELRQQQEQLNQQLTARQAMIERLSRSRRVAHLQITDQKKDLSGGVESTKVLFIELNDRGSELARQSFTIPGDVLFVDALTVKFNPEQVAQGDPLLGHTLILLRRIYSDRMPPKDGFRIDTPGAIPPGYACSDAGRFEKRLWENFWELATDPAKAQELGVRVAQGEAVYKQPVRIGQSYELVVDAVGGMSLTPLPSGDRAALTKADG